MTMGRSNAAEREVPEALAPEDTAAVPPGDAAGPSVGAATAPGEGGDAPMSSGRTEDVQLALAETVRAAWVRAAALFGVGLVVLAVAYYETIAAAIGVWSGSVTYNHAFMILPVVGYLIWLRQEALARLTPEASAWGPAVVAIASAVWLVGRETQTEVIQQFAVVAILQGLVLGLFGRRVVMAIRFPLFYLYFAVPFGDFLVPILQDWTAAFVVAGLQVIGVPVFIDGILIMIPNGVFEVAEACAGLRFLIATLALGTLCTNLLFHTWWRRLVFIALSVVIPIVANGFRAFGIVYIAHITDNEVAVGVDHIVYGWLFFAFVTVLLLAAGMALRDRDLHGFVSDGPTHTGTVGSRRRAPAVVVGGATLALLVAAPALAHIRANQHPSPAVVGLVAPDVGAPWVRAGGASADWRPEFRGADAEIRERYVAGDHGVDIYIAYYADQREGAELVSWANRIADPGVWTRLGGGHTQLVADGRPVDVNVTRIASRRGQRVVFQWYWVDGRFTHIDHLAKLLSAKARLLGGTRASASILVSAPYDEEVRTAKAKVQDLLADMPPLEALLRAAAEE